MFFHFNPLNYYTLTLVPSQYRKMTDWQKTAHDITTITLNNIESLKLHQITFWLRKVIINAFPCWFNTNLHISDSTTLYLIILCILLMHYAISKLNPSNKLPRLVPIWTFSCSLFCTRSIKNILSGFRSISAMILAVLQESTKPSCSRPSDSSSR